MIYVSSDLHGYPLDKFIALLKKANFSDKDYLFILGDVIDRGEHGVEILRWLLLQPNVELILGNHEDMLLGCDFLFDEITEESLADLSSVKLNRLSHWKRNGANPTIEALRALDTEQRKAILEYLSQCPVYDEVTIGTRRFVLVHGGLGDYSEEKRIEDYTPYELMWTRPMLSDNYSFDFITVFGHTPTHFYSPHFRGRMIKTSTWIDIDTGAASGMHPMLLRLDDLKEFYADQEI
jgi:serine/threonine protein phosphatase 1